MYISLPFLQYILSSLKYNPLQRIPSLYILIVFFSQISIFIVFIIFISVTINHSKKKYIKYTKDQKMQVEKHLITKIPLSMILTPPTLSLAKNLLQRFCYKGAVGLSGQNLWHYFL